MLADVFGWSLLNARLLADQYASHGFLVYLPDFYLNDSLSEEVETLTLPDSSRTYFRAAVDVSKAGGMFVPWMYRHRESVMRPLVEQFLSALRTSKPDAKIGAIGFCWGGRYAVLLSQKDAPVQVDVAVACHPGNLAYPEDIEKIDRPVSIQCGDADKLVPVKNLDIAASVMKQKTVPGEVVIYKDMIHGFAIRGDLSVQKNLDAREQCLESTVKWLSMYM